MVWLVASVLYGLAGIVCLRLVTGHLAYHFAATSIYSRGRKPDGEQWFGAFCIGLVAGTIWPLAIVFTATGRKFSIGAERAEVQRQQAARIAELEKELGIR